MEIAINDEKRQLVGNLSTVGDELPHFKVSDKNGDKVKTRQLLGKIALLSVVPDINAPVCNIQTQRFDSTIDQFPEVGFPTTSANMTENRQKWCTTEGVKNMELVSDREESFGCESRLLIPDEGIFTRSVWILGPDGKVVYRQIVTGLADEPDYEKAIAELKELV